MERLTVRNEAGMACVSRKIEESENGGFMLVDRLAAYESTGLEPKQILELKSFTQGGVHKSDEGWLHVQALLQAEHDGRLLVLPCIRPFINGEYGIAYECLWWNERSGFMTQSFKTREEADAALKGGEE